MRLDNFIVNNHPVGDGRNHAVAEGYDQPPAPVHEVVGQMLGTTYRVCFITAVVDAVKEAVDET